MPKANPALIPLFPLASVVLFPGLRVPLHVFETRYRQMMSDALSRERVLGMVTVRPEHHGHMSGNPPIFPVGCAGFIADVERFADGRFDLVLQATRRFRVLREDPPAGARLYRVAEVEWLEEALPCDPRAVKTLRARVVDTLETLARRSHGESPAEMPLARFVELDDASFTNSLSQVLEMAAAEKQGLLEAPGVAERLAQLEALLRFHLALLDAPGVDSSETVH